MPSFYLSKESRMLHVNQTGRINFWVKRNQRYFIQYMVILNQLYQQSLISTNLKPWIADFQISTIQAKAKNEMLANLVLPVLSDTPAILRERRITCHYYSPSLVKSKKDGNYFCLFFFISCQICFVF